MSTGGNGSGPGGGSGSAPPTRRVSPVIAIVGVALLVVTSVIFVLGLLQNGEQSKLEEFYFQLFLAGFGIAGGWVLSTATGRRGERERMEGRAQSAVRRSFQLLVTLGKINVVTQREIDSLQSGSAPSVPVETVRAMLIRVQALAEAQTATADDAISDWRDFAPAVVDDEVLKLRRREADRGASS